MSAREVTVTVRARAFGGVLAEHQCLVDLDEPRVRVWDRIGNIYTVCHSLSPRDTARIVRLARREAQAS